MKKEGWRRDNWKKEGWGGRTAKPRGETVRHGGVEKGDRESRRGGGGETGQ